MAEKKRGLALFSFSLKSAFKISAEDSMKFLHV